MAKNRIPQRAKAKIRSVQVKKKKRKGIFFILGSLVLLGIAVFLYAKKSEPPAPGDGVLATPESEYNFGYVSVRKGGVSTEVPLVNIGEGDLTITFLDTSCGCTSAQVINNGEAGPIFGMSMHGQSPTSWRTVIKPGQKASLKIYYDPYVHRDLRGPVTRVITITTNEKLHPEKQIEIKVNQVD
jgi:HYDIN/CFA65/VesB-like, Ig-like domain